jgi:hypothetical protein
MRGLQAHSSGITMSSGAIQTTLPSSEAAMGLPMLLWKMRARRTAREGRPYLHRYPHPAVGGAHEVGVRVLYNEIVDCDGTAVPLNAGNVNRRSRAGDDARSAMLCAQVRYAQASGLCELQDLLMSRR